MKNKIQYTDLKSFETNYNNWRSQIQAHLFEILAVKSSTNNLEFYYQTEESMVDIDSIPIDYKILKASANAIEVKNRILPNPCSGNPRCEESDFVKIEDIVTDGLFQEIWRDERNIFYLEFSFLSNIKVPNSTELEMIKNDVFVVKKKLSPTTTENYYYKWIDITLQNKLFTVSPYNNNAVFHAQKISIPMYIVDDPNITELDRTTFVFGIRLPDNNSPSSDGLIIETTRVKWQ